MCSVEIRIVNCGNYIEFKLIVSNEFMLVIFVENFSY